MIFISFLFAYMMSQFFRSFVAIISPNLMSDLALNAAELSNMTAAWFITFALSQFLVGWGLDRFGPRRVVSGSMLFAVAGALLFANAQSYLHLQIGMGLIGIGCSSILMGSFYYFGKIYAPERFGLLSSYILGIGSLGNLLGASPLAYSVTLFGWRGSMMGIAALAFLAAFMIFTLVRDPIRDAVLLESDGFFGGILAIIKLKPIWPIIPLMFVSYATIAAERGLWITPYLRGVYQLEGLPMSYVVFGMALSMSLGALAYGPVVKWAGSARKVIVAGSLLTAACFALIGFFPQIALPFAAASLIGAGFFGFSYGAIVSHAKLFFPSNLLGRGVAFTNFLSIGGVALMLNLTGAYVQNGLAAGKMSQAEIFSHMHLFFAALLLVAGLIYLKTPEGR